MITLGWITVLMLMAYVLWPILVLGLESHYVNKLEEELPRIRHEKAEKEKIVRGKEIDTIA